MGYEDDFKDIQERAQQRWEEEEAFRVEEDSDKEKFYCLEMYPYPSGSSLHMGHLRNYTIGDATARYRRMNGFSVLYTMGYDAFGLPAENAAKKDGIHPREYTKKAIEIISSQFKEAGLSYDWSRTLASCDEDYYKWNQWFFLKMMEQGIAYRKQAPVNWCPECATVLANEQVEQGKCWRHGDTEVEVKQLEQWFFRITGYAQRLLDDIEKLDGWSERIKSMQRNWIGRSEGTQVDFPIEGTDEVIPIFTTRVDTIFGVTFMVYAPEHPRVMEMVKDTEYEKPVAAFIKKTVLQDRFTRESDDTEKEGMFIGKYAINPLTGEKVPIYIGNFVLMEYGAGCVMAVPAHDQRDFEFAKKYEIPIKVVIKPDAFDLDPKKMSRAFLDDGTLINSGAFDGTPNRMAIEDIQKYLEEKKIGKRVIQYKIRDWLISRQRYWGTPIPVVYCDKCGVVPIKEEDLPVKLPEDVEFKGKGNPLLSSASFLEVVCPSCGGKAQRETDTMDGFMDSCWYFLAYTTRDRSKQPFDRKKVDYWMPVDQYIGGAEHAVMHLLYARFFAKVLKDMGMIGFDEPFTRLFNQGIVYKDGSKMSKSTGNLVTQAAISKKYGIDTARYFLMSLASPEKTVEWDDNGVAGSFRALKRIYALLDVTSEINLDATTASKMHQAIKSVSMHIESFSYNLALVDIMTFVKHLETLDMVAKEAVETLAHLISPFCPHLAQGMWERLGHTDLIAHATWPVLDESKIDEKADAVEELKDQVMSDIARLKELTGIEPAKVTVVLADEWKYVFVAKLKEQLVSTYNPGEIMKAMMEEPTLKSHGKQISKLVPQLLKNQSRIPKVLLEREIERVALSSLEGIAVVESDAIDGPKADQGMPGKPAIVLE